MHSKTGVNALSGSRGEGHGSRLFVQGRQALGY